MKKLLVTAIGAAAAFGASAGLISTQRFENVTGELFPRPMTIESLNTLAGGNYWSGDELTNTYSVITGINTDDFPQDMQWGTPTKALEIKTTFGNPLTVKAIAGDNTSTNIPASGLYFDSLVKFTVCEEEPEQTYDGAKIIMWLQEETDGNDNITGTNIMVRASYANADGTFTPTNFVCKRFTGSIDSWYRVTIKTWASILNNKTVPGFAIFIDGVSVNVADEYTMADEIAANLTEAAGFFGKDEVFPSLVQGEATGVGSITSASFDGTGKLTDLVFTDEAPFTAAEDYEAPKASVTIGNSVLPPFTSLESAVETLNGVTVAQGQDPVTAKFTLLAGVNFEGPLTINNTDENVTIVIDLNGMAITNTAESGYALVLESPVTITDSSDEKTGAIVSDITGEGNGAIYVGESGALELLAGTIDGWIDRFEDDRPVYLKGGTVKQDNIEPYTGYTLVASPKGEGFYDVVELVTFTATFVTYDGTAHYTQYDIPSNTFATAPGIAPIRDHYTFAGWTPAVAETPIVSNTTFTATWTPNSYTITFVYGLNGEKSTSQSYTYGLSPELPGDAKIDGYALVWTPAIETVVSNTTYTADYEAMLYTITYKEPDGSAFTRWASEYSAPATYTVASAVTLPVAANVNLGTGASFNNWTNAEGTVISDTAGYATNLVVFANLTPVVAPTYPSYIDTSDATVKNQYDAWKAANNVASGDNVYEADFLLNVAPGTVGAMLTTTDVTISGTTVIIDINRGALNGHPYVKKAATLVGLENAPKTAIDITPADQVQDLDNGGRIELTGESGTTMFYQIGVQAKPLSEN